jgi:2-polyprenyl-3-methyl-5-hydroxy-6-metoxy-1,4-benzoquinol methylase
VSPDQAGEPEADEPVLDVVDRAPAEHQCAALDLLAAATGVDEHGYVQLQTTAYRGHHLLAQAVLDVTRPGDRVFEGGVSSGYFAAVLAAAGLRVDGHELDPHAATDARRVCEQVFVGDLDRFDVAELPHDYEVLLFGDTLEHLPDPPAVLRRLRTRLAPGGHLVLSIPNVANWAVRLGLLAGHFDYRERGILDRTHLRFYTEATLRAMLGEGGFEVERLVASVPVPGLVNPGAARLAHRLGNLRPSLLAYTFVVTARAAGRSWPR